MQHCRAESGWGVEEEPWQSHTFSELSRQQQNTEIYQVSTQFWSAALQCCTVGQAVAGTVVARARNTQVSKLTGCGRSRWKA